MKTKLMMAAVAATALISITGCANGPTNRQLGIGAGAVAGGVVGSALGGTAATVGGAAAGALIGNEVTKPNRR